MQSIKRKRMLVQACRLFHLSVGLSVCLFVRLVNCGKTADCIWMPFGVVNGVGRWMGVLDETRDRPMRRGNFGREFGLLIVTNGDFLAYSSP